MPKPRPPAVSYTSALSQASADKRIDILRLIARGGSISQAGREAGGSYKAAGLPALSELSVRAGMRNQLPCAVQALQGQGQIVRVRLRLADGTPLASTTSGLADHSTSLPVV